MADRRKEHRFRLAGLFSRLGHVLQRLFHFDARGDIHQHADGDVLVAIARVHKANLQIGVVAGEHVDKVDLLSADNLRQPLPILVGQHIEIVMRQLVTEDVSPIQGAQNTDPHRRRGDNLAVELLMLLEALSIDLRRDKYFALVHPRQGKQRNPHQHVE